MKLTGILPTTITNILIALVCVVGLVITNNPLCILALMMLRDMPFQLMTDDEEDELDTDAVSEQSFGFIPKN